MKKSLHNWKRVVAVGAVAAMTLTTVLSGLPGGNKVYADEPEEQVTDLAAWQFESGADDWAHSSTFDYQQSGTANTSSEYDTARQR